MMRVREFCAGDLQAVAGITRASPEAAQWSDRNFEESLSAAGAAKCLVAEQDGRVIGFVCYRVAADEAEILNIAVLPEARRRGCATRLLLQAMRECATGGVSKLFLEVRQDNEGALRFYGRQGFERVGERLGYYNNPLGDAVVMVRKVPE